ALSGLLSTTLPVGLINVVPSGNNTNVLAMRRMAANALSGLLSTTLPVGPICVVSSGNNTNARAMHRMAASALSGLRKYNAARRPDKRSAIRQ
ncbi:hypothetical protein LDJ78_22495, partial [Citrobacter portucalensis]|uniref:hypothetical protein n=1 Tax=Citrobacter portucalensis TaxID=1639133 RepID=UPI001CDA0A64